MPSTGFFELMAFDPRRREGKKIPEDTSRLLTRMNDNVTTGCEKVATNKLIKFNRTTFSTTLFIIDR